LASWSIVSSAAELDPLRCGRLLQRLRVGVRHEEVDALDVGPHHVGDRVAARAADADHRDAGGQIVHFGTKEFDAHRRSPHNPVDTLRPGP
jgi:hypothetical protein